MNEMTVEAARHMPQMMGAAPPVAKGAMLAATGYVAGRNLLGGALLRNPWVLLAAGVAAGYFLRKHQAEIALAVSKASGMGKDFLLEQRESLADLIEEAKREEAKKAGGQPAGSGAEKPAQPPA